MSRELKFRAWSKKRNKLYEVLVLLKDKMNGLWAKCRGLDIIEQKDIVIDVQPKDCIIMQYTGLKDKNSKEIYEGDILDSISGAWDIRGLVDFGMWGWQIDGYYKEDKTKWCFNFGEIMQCYEQIDRFEDFEIIGNIYENPELLEVRDA